MADWGTFSAAVDEVVARTGRPDRRAAIAGWLRASMREIQVRAFFHNDLVEDQLTAIAEPFIWECPPGFRQLFTPMYPELLDDHGRPIFPRFAPPSKMQQRELYYWYRSGDSLVFAGMGNGGLVDVAYFSYFTPLAYIQEETARPATYDLATGAWAYLSAGTPAEEAVARARVTNWLLFDYFEACIEGATAKLFKSYNDERASSAFALFRSLSNDVLKGAASVSVDG